jgi:DNA-directed RNA polymerase subunit RPC12/RpoP
MDISCKKCGQKYHIPDEKVHERRLYFNCEKCDYKIIIDQRGESWTSFRGLSLERFSSREILEGVFYSFNLRNILFTFFLLLVYTAILFIVSLIFSKNALFFAGHPSLSVFIVFIITLLMIYLFDIHLYMLSKSIYHNISYEGRLSFSSIAPEINNDIKPIFFISIGFILLFSILFFPVYLMKSKYSLVYEGIFHSVNLLLLALILFTFFFKGIIYSFIAFRVRTPKTSLRNLIGFIRIENLNLPFYSLIIEVVCLFVLIIVALLFGGGTIIIFSLIGLQSGKLFPGLFTGGLGDFSASAGTIFAGSSEGMILIIVSTGLVFLFILSYLINLYQSLSSVAVFIMEKNPGRSVSRRAILLVAVLIAVAVNLAVLFIR